MRYEFWCSSALVAAMPEPLRATASTEIEQYACED